jgi:MerR family transcriptional regulator, light-induced transcriptional regulator
MTTREIEEPRGGATLTIRDLARMTGLPPATLRAWELRHGFPRTTRLPSGHRRYSDRDVEQVRRVVRERDAGLSLTAAIARATSAGGPAEPSIFAGLRQRRPDLPSNVFSKRALTALSYAIEDECCARAERPVFFASFQSERFYRQVERRWRTFARTSRFAAVLADFPEVRTPPDGPMEIPIERSDPMFLEWSLICVAPGYWACLTARERPGQDELPDAQRRFEAVWTVEPDAVREAARMAVGLAARAAPQVMAAVGKLIAETAPVAGVEVPLVTALAGRMVAYMDADEA